MTERTRDQRTRDLGIAAGALLGLAGAAAFYSLRVEPENVESREETLRVPNLPDAADGLSILFLTDPHVWEIGPLERRVIELCARFETPDLIVWGGDFLGDIGAIDEAVELVESVARLFPDVPTFGIWGNAEHKITRNTRWDLARRLAETGMILLCNENRRVRVRDFAFTIVGVDDPYYGFADLDAAIDGVSSGEFTLLLSHSPQMAILAARAGVNVMLSGHTHGGQVRIPGFGALKTQNPLSRRFDAGVFDRARLAKILGRDPGGNLVTFVSRGIGLAFVPRMPWLAPRFLCRPEITLLKLSKRDPSASA